MRRKLKQFPDLLNPRIDRRTERVSFDALPSFDSYVALQHSLEEAGGAIQMFHPKYITPQAYYAVVGVKGRTPGKLEALRSRLQAVPGVRSAIVDDERWFTNERGIDVGGVVVFADTTPRLKLDLPRAATAAGFVYEPRNHGHAADDHDEWSEMNHAFAGVCLLLLAALGMLRLALARPPWLVRYGTAFVWLALGIFLLIRADRDAWPLGRISWWESFSDWDTAGHRLGTALVFLIAIGDFIRIRKGWQVNPALSRWGTLVVGVVGCTLLFTHLHTTIDPAHYAVVRRMNAQHVAMGLAALLFALTKFAWETWQVPRRGGQYVWLGCLGMMGVILSLYVE